MTSSIFTEWCAEQRVEIVYIRPGKPNQNAYIELFNRSFMTEILDANLFHSMNQVGELSWAWRITYNEERPHESLGNVTPIEFKQLVTAGISSNELCA